MATRKEDLFNKSYVGIEYPNGKKKLSHKVVKRSNARCTFKRPGFKSKIMEQMESALELDAGDLHDSDSSIISYSVQPAKLTFHLDGQWHKHFPDALVITNVRKVFKEIKTDKAANDPFIQERTRYLSKVLPVYGYDYELMLENEIRQEPRLSNVKFLLRHGRKEVFLADMEAIRFYIARNGGLTWGEVTQGVFGQYSVAMVCNLILRGYLQINLMEHWCDETSIAFGEK